MNVKDLPLDRPGCSKDNLEESEDCEMDEDDENVLFVKMDIKETLNSLRLYLEETFKLSLEGCTFTLQQSNTLSGETTLSDMCEGGEADVQVVLRVTDTPAPRIDILDILTLDDCPLSQDELTDGDEFDEPETEEDKTLWLPSKEYNDRMLKLDISSDPSQWEVSDVRHWLLWAVRHFSLASVRLVDWMVSGSQLCSMSLPEFRKRVPSDPGNLFWKHCLILRKYKVVAEMSKSGMTFAEVMSSTDAPIWPGTAERDSVTVKKEIDENNELEVTSTSDSKETPSPEKNQLSANVKDAPVEVEEESGETHLWQFLLELLTDPEWMSVIHWVGTNGSFFLKDPSAVARLWGQRRCNPTMTYEKFSRSLRHYYKGDIINSVPGLKFQYRFVCDLKLLLGYSAAELKNLVEETAKKREEEQSKHVNDDTKATPLL